MSSFAKQRIIGLSLFVVALLVAIPITVTQLQQQQETRSRANVNNWRVYFSPASVTKANGEIFTTDIMLDTNGDGVTGIDFGFDSNTTKFDIISFTPSTLFNDQLYNNGSTTGGGDLFYGATNTTNPPPAGNALRVGTLTLRAKSSGTNIFTFHQLDISTRVQNNLVTTAPPPFSLTVGSPPTPTTGIQPTQQPIFTITPMPTPTFTPGGSQLAFSLKLQGIGPQDNPMPLSPQRKITVELFNSRNQRVTEKISFFTLTGSGTFFGVVDAGIIPTGDYTIKAKTDRYLRRLIPPGIHKITTGYNALTTGTIPTLVVGDVNGDNLLSLLDYNILRDCYQGINPLPMRDPNSRYNLPACNAHPAKPMTDFDDNGIVNEVDYTYFIRSLATQVGE